MTILYGRCDLYVLFMKPFMAHRIRPNAKKHLFDSDLFDQFAHFVHYATECRLLESVVFIRERKDSDARKS